MAKKKKSYPTKWIELEKLELDHGKNPRLPSSLIDADETDILDYMVTKGSVMDLMRSIGEKGYFGGEPLLGVWDKAKQKAIVVEGNRRLSAAKLLNNPKLSSKRKRSLVQIANEAIEDNIPNELPIILFPDRSEILDYLGYRHITGVKQWDSLAKAKYLEQLWDASDITDYRKRSIRLAKIIGSRADYVRKLLCALNVYREMEDSDFYDIDGMDKSVSESFSFITTALGFTNIQEFLDLESGEDIDVENLDNKALKELSEWMFDRSGGATRLGESRNISQLAMVVGNKSALTEFRKGTDLETAYHISGGADEVMAESITKAYKQIEVAHRYAAYANEMDTLSLEKLNDMLKLIRAIKNQITVDDE